MADFLLFVAVIGTLIFAHELGHFLAAKSRGIHVKEFGIGFPPRLVPLFTRGETQFTLNWIPLGGFVRIAGEDDPSIPNGLASSNKRTRAFVLLAGPAANVLLGFFAFMIAFKFAAPDPARVLITGVAEGSPAYQSGIEVGDLVSRVEDVPITGFESMQEAILSNLATETHIELAREGQMLVVTLTPRENPPEGQGSIGVILGNPVRQTTWGEAIGLSWDSIQLQVVSILQLPGRLIRGETRPEEARVSGLKGIHDMLAWASSIDRSSQRPFVTLNLVGVISIGLALANLLPFPALDGGRLMFVFLEAVLGRRVAPKFEGYAHAIGFAVLLVLMVYINLQDFINPIALP